MQPIDVAVKQSAGSDAQQIYASMIDSLQTLQGEDLTRAKTVLTSLLTKAKGIIDERVYEAQLPLGSPDPVPRFTKRIPTASEHLDLAERAAQMTAKAATKTAQILAKDRRILAARQYTQQEEEGIQIQEDDIIQTLSQTSIGSTITVAARVSISTAPFHVPSSPDPLGAWDTDEEINAALQQDEEDAIPKAPPPPAKAPVQGDKRKRAQSGYYADLVAGKRRH